MIATVNGITVSGTPEEIKQFSEITSKTETTTRVTNCVTYHAYKELGWAPSELAKVVSDELLQKQKLQGRI